MSKLVRFGVAMEKELLEGFDELITQRGYANRSEALRDLVRRELDDAAWQTGAPTCATITLIYDHHKPELSERLTAIQHDSGALIISALHVHLDHDHCMEVIATRGPASELKALADQLIGAKGVLSGDIVAARLPEGDSDEHKHAHPHKH
ncbi:MAG: nickel-responsive transcriptional regulator NikR [Polyangiaceae bacterium]